MSEILSIRRVTKIGHISPPSAPPWPPPPSPPWHDRFVITSSKCRKRLMKQLLLCNFYLPASSLFSFPSSLFWWLMKMTQPFEDSKNVFNESKLVVELVGIHTLLTITFRHYLPLIDICKNLLSKLKKNWLTWSSPRFLQCTVLSRSYLRILISSILNSMICKWLIFVKCTILWDNPELINLFITAMHAR